MPRRRLGSRGTIETESYGLKVMRQSASGEPYFKTGDRKMPEKREKQEQPVQPPTRQERMRYNQYVKKQMRTGGTPAPLNAWLRTQRGTSD